MSAIRLQRSLIESELRTGSFYGDEGDTSRGGTWGRRQPQENIDEDELDRLIEEASEDLESELPGDPSLAGGPEEASGEDDGVSTLLADIDETSPDPPGGISVDDEDQPETAVSESEIKVDVEPETSVAAEPEAQPQPVVVPVVVLPNASEAEDPDIARFLDGDDFEDVFRDL